MYNEHFPIEKKIVVRQSAKLKNINSICHFFVIRLYGVAVHKR